MTEWRNCYNDGWQGVIVPEAFAHPAKFARGLIRRIYEHMLAAGYLAPGDSVVDCFGGVGLGGLDAMSMGLHWTGVELEPRFVELGQRNIAKWQRDLAMLGDRVGTARLLQGDSRRLLEVVIAGQMAATISSPPYDTDQLNGGGRDMGRGLQAMKAGYGLTPGQLGAMPSGDYAAAVISSPPFSGDKNLMAVNDQGVRKDMVARRGMVESDTQQSPGNLAALRADNAGFSAAVSSPPYADAVNGGEGPGARHDPIYHNGDNAFKQSSDNGYGATDGQLGRMAGDGWQAAVSSPPFEASDMRKGGSDLLVQQAIRRGRDPNKPGTLSNTTLTPYGSDLANIGNYTGGTFWAAARLICEQTYAALRPGGYAAWVCKDFVRKGQRVPFSDQWQALCVAVGFESAERIRALLVDDHGDQLDIFGGATARRKQRKSFFRLLAEKKGSPRIDHEDVIIMRKPTRAAANGARSDT